MTIRSLLGDHRTGARTTAYGPAGRRVCSAPAGLHAAARRRRHCSGRPRRAARRCLHFFVYPSFGHTRCLGSLPELAAALDGAVVDGVANCAAQSCTHSPAAALDGVAAGDATDRTDC